MLTLIIMLTLVVPTLICGVIVLATVSSPDASYIASLLICAIHTIAHIPVYTALHALTFLTGGYRLNRHDPENKTLVHTCPTAIGRWFGLLACRVSDAVELDPVFIHAIETQNPRAGRLLRARSRYARLLLTGGTREAVEQAFRDAYSEDLS
jgi:hypothetical protein